MAMHNYQSPRHIRDTSNRHIIKQIKQHKNGIKSLHLKSKNLSDNQTINSNKIDSILSILKHTVGIPALINNGNIYNKENYLNVSNTFQQQQKVNIRYKNALNKQNGKLRSLQQLTKPILLLNK
eukprot:14523_1